MIICRGLEYILVLLKELLKDKKGGTPNENIRQFCQTAYETTLKMYHGWIVQKVFSVSDKLYYIQEPLLNARRHKQ